jgi:hypothetical protein
MKIRSHMGVSVDGFVSTPDGWPVLLSMPDFAGAESYGLLGLLADCGAVVMGRTTFEPALDAPKWPWPGLEVFVLTSSPLREGAPDGIVTAADPAALLERMRAGDFDGDVHLHDAADKGADRDHGVIRELVHGIGNFSPGGRSMR